MEHARLVLIILNAVSFSNILHALEEYVFLHYVLQILIAQLDNSVIVKNAVQLLTIVPQIPLVYQDNIAIALASAIQSQAGAVVVQIALLDIIALIVVVL